MSFRMLKRNITGSSPERDPAEEVPGGHVYGWEMEKYVPFSKGIALQTDFSVPRDEINIKSQSYASSDDVNKLRDEIKVTKQEQGALAAMDGLAEVSQALINYKQYSENAERNIRLIQEDIDRLGQDAQDTRRLGKADAFQEQLKGRQRGDDAKLKLAAQGQKVSGQGVKRVSKAHRVAAATRAAQRENAALSRALGLEQEGVNLKVRQADERRKKAYARLQSNVKAFGGLASAGLGVYRGLA